jgi:hypothetical protein
MNGHETLPELHFFHLLRRCDLTPSSRQELVVDACVAARSPAINHETCAFIENKRYPTNPRAKAGMVNRNGRSVYQTDQVFVVYSPRPRSLG